MIEPYEEVEGTYASTSMDPDLRVNLGEVPVYGVKKALFKVTNPSTVTIRINSIEYDTESVGEDELPLTTGDLWGTPTYRRSLTDTSSYTLPFDVAPGDEKLIEIPYAPSLEGPARAKAVVNSTSSTPFISLFVDAEGKYYGQPDIEVEYNGIVSPSDPESYCAGGACTMTQAVDFGNIGLTAEGTARIVLEIPRLVYQSQAETHALLATFKSAAPTPACLACALKRAPTTTVSSASSALRQTRSTFPNLMSSVTSPAKYGSS